MLIETTSAVVRPDGGAVVLDADRRTASLVDMRVPALAERAIASCRTTRWSDLGSRRAAAVLGMGEVEVIDLGTGARSIVDPNDRAPDSASVAIVDPVTGPLNRFRVRKGSPAWRRP